MKRSIHDHLRWGSTRLSRQWHTQGWFVHGKVCWWVRAVNTSATVLKRQRGSGRRKKPTHPVAALPLTRVVRTWEKQGPYWMLFCVSLGALHRECRVALAWDSHGRTQQQRGFSSVNSNERRVQWRDDRGHPYANLGRHCLWLRPFVSRFVFFGNMNSGRLLGCLALYHKIAK